MINGAFIPYQWAEVSTDEMLEKSKSFFEWMDQRRTVRTFSDKPVPREVLENIIKTANTAPSGANKQPWSFCLISNSELKKKIREKAEEIEYEAYHGRMSDTWLSDLEPLGTDWNKPFIETAPWIIIMCKKPYDYDDDGKRENNYYVNESAGLAAGFLLAAIHNAGLASLTHTPSPMGFLQKILDRPDNEKPFLLLPVGYPAKDTVVPDIKRKKLDEVVVYFD